MRGKIQPQKITPRRQSELVNLLKIVSYPIILLSYSVLYGAHTLKIFSNQKVLVLLTLKLLLVTKVSSEISNPLTLETSPFSPSI